MLIKNCKTIECSLFLLLMISHRFIPKWPRTASPAQQRYKQRAIVALLPLSLLVRTSRFPSRVFVYFSYCLLPLHHPPLSSMSSLVCGRIRGVVGQFLRAPRATANVAPNRHQLLSIAACNRQNMNQRSFCTSLVGTHRSDRQCLPRTPRYFSSQAIILEAEDDGVDMNRDPLFIHVYPGSRVLEMALPYDAMKLKQIDAMIRSTQPVMQEKSSSHRSLSVEGCNVLSPALVTSLQAQLERLCSNASVRIDNCHFVYLPFNAFQHPDYASPS